MFDKSSVLDLVYDEDAQIPYMYYATGDMDSIYNKLYSVINPGDTEEFYMAGNPIVYDEEYIPERNAINGNALLKSFDYGQIRNAGAGRFYMTNKYGKVLASQEFGPSYAAFYHVNQGVWMYTKTRTSLNYTSLSGEGADPFRHLRRNER